MTAHRHALGARQGLVCAIVVMLWTSGAAVGCAQYGVVDDGSSVSFGPSNQGKLINPARLPVRGEGHVIPRRWAHRGLSYGTDELVAMIVHAGRHMAVTSPGSLLRVGDLSPARGGPSSWHRSHQTGRDVDLLLFARSDKGEPIELETMVRFQADGSAVVTDAQGAPASIYFDTERNWLLVRALIENPIAEIQYLFIYRPLAGLLIDHARAIGESDELIEQASYLLHQPSDSAPHDDHLHVRIYCAADDRTMGCFDRGALRWAKKGYKYGPEVLAASSAPTLAQTALLAPMPAMMVLGVLPFVP